MLTFVAMPAVLYLPA